MLIRSIKQQFNYAIGKASRTGQSKHSAKAAGTYKPGELYGNETVTAYRDTAKNFSKWLSHNHPEITKVTEITPDHVQSWIDDRSENWTKATLENHITRIKYLEQQAQKAFGKDKVHFYDKDIKRPETKEAARDKAMSHEDFLKLRERMENSRSFAKDALEIAYRAGLRIDEIAHLRREDIDLEKKTIFVSTEGAKNGKERSVPLRDKDLEYFKELLDRHPQEGYLTTVQAKSIDKAIRRYMADTRDEKGQLLSEKYLRETAHTIRKLYATERMQEERGSAPLSDKREEMKCWDRVSHELGHGDGREALYKVYCKG